MRHLTEENQNDSSSKAGRVLPEERLIAVGDSTGSVQILRIETP